MKKESLVQMLAKAIKKHREEDEKNLTRRQSPALYQIIIDELCKTVEKDNSSTTLELPRRLYSIALIFSITAATEGRRLSSVEHILAEYRCTREYTELMYYVNREQSKDDVQDGRTPSTRFARRYEEVPDAI